jgi:anti-sigma factor RsiW
MSQHGMTCREFVDFLMEYLDGELPAESKSVFETHLEKCPPCGAYLHNYEQTVRMAADMVDCEEQDALPEAPEALVQAVLRARKAADSEGDGPSDAPPA